MSHKPTPTQGVDIYFEISIHLHLFPALFLLPRMLLIDLLGEQLATLVRVDEVLTKFVSFLTQAIQRTTHYAGLSLEGNLYLEDYLVVLNLTCIVSSPA